VRQAAVIPQAAKPASAWPAIEADLRRALLRAGKAEREIVTMLDVLRPVVAAVERAGTRVDSDVA
jgi:hypothetical protein